MTTSVTNEGAGEGEGEGEGVVAMAPAARATMAAMEKRILNWSKIKGILDFVDLV